ncbi:hypothetical protein AQPE_0455 [Aquipluma nitroreducens]|uniref:Uncharacterized protein n=1 Tax=Aquipluma nitroreducens TaxID=2010828 RepID=A0A5K7S420_9BACT|nr:hypothetical protein AQPE_0455 [Aquipluma nitroreducens]
MQGSIPALAVSFIPFPGHTCLSPACSQKFWSVNRFVKIKKQA